MVSTNVSSSQPVFVAIK